MITETADGGGLHLTAPIARAVLGKILLFEQSLDEQGACEGLHRLRDNEGYIRIA